MANCKQSKPDPQTTSASAPHVGVGVAMSAVNAPEAEIISVPVLYQWMIPGDSLVQPEDLLVMLKIAAIHGIRSVDIEVDNVLLGRWPQGGIIRYESEFRTWSDNGSFMVIFHVTDSDFPKGWHRVKVTATDSAGNQNVRPANVLITRSLDYIALVHQDTISGLAGWNLISSITRKAPTMGIVTQPSGMLQSAVYGYNGLYYKADSVVPGTGYWIKLSAPSKIIFNRVSSMTAISSRSTPPPRPPEQ